MPKFEDAAVEQYVDRRFGEGIQRPGRHKSVDLRYGPRVPTLDERFWSLVHKTDDCWLWTGRLNHSGYGQIDQWVNGKTQTWLTHRWALVQRVGSLPAETPCACHVCDNPACVRNDEPGYYEVNGVLRVRWGHLFVGTRADNQQDMARKGRRPWGEAHENHKLTTEQVHEVRHIWATRKVRLDTRGWAVRGEPITCIKLGVQFGVSEATIRDIIHRRTRVHE